MFTGIIEEIGKVSSIKRNSNSIKIAIKAEKILGDASIGDSIAVNGVCLTISEFEKDEFTADIMPVTLTSSSLKNLKKGGHVNLERAMSASGRFGGHIVSGHIDGIGTILEIKKDDNAIWYKISTNKKIMNYIIEKGSVAIDGISLTVSKIEKYDFSVSIIPQTKCKTILGEKIVGDVVNIENDCIGKYIYKFININSENSNITKSFLLENGF